MNDHIHYFKIGNAYQLQDEEYSLIVDIAPIADIHTPLVSLVREGDKARLTIRRFFCWDGCSGPTIDDDTNMRGCMIHDALYYLLRMGMLDLGWRYAVDRELYKAMLQDCAPRFRATYYQWAVNEFALKAAVTPRQLYVAPKRKLD
jgi:hypothetical protein